MKAIETVYNGYRFRSRLEARWAVFFDAIELEYQYEPQGFMTGDKEDIFYLPDFYFPSLNVYAEIKPNRELDDRKAEIFAYNISYEDNIGGVLVCYGLPSDHDIRFMTCWETDIDGGGWFDSDYSNIEIRFDKQLYGRGVCLFVDWQKEELAFLNTNNIIVPYDHIHTVGTILGNPFVKAEMKAKQARFEHGEKPI